MEHHDDDLGDFLGGAGNEECHRGSKHSAVVNDDLLSLGLDQALLLEEQLIREGHEEGLRDGEGLVGYSKSRSFRSVSVSSRV